MKDYVKYEDALGDPRKIMIFGSSVFGRWIISQKSGSKVDLQRHWGSTIHSEEHNKNPNVLGLRTAMDEFTATMSEQEKEKYLCIEEVPFFNPDQRLFSDLYNKFGGTNNESRGWFRSDGYFPYLGFIVELDSRTFHTAEEIAIDDAKENIIFSNYRIPTKLRINLAVKNKWELEREKKKLFDLLRKASVVPPIIHFPSIVESWNADNSDILGYIPYIESLNDYYVRHKDMYKPRTLELNANILPENLRNSLNDSEVEKKLKNVYKRIENIDLRIITP